MNMGFKFLHAADIHLGATTLMDYLPVGPLTDIGRSAHTEAFANVIDVALSQKVDFAIFAGDTFHRPATDQSLGELFADGLHRLDNKGIRSFIITGNHDPETPLLEQGALPDSSVIFRSGGSYRLDELGVVLHGARIPDSHTGDDPLIWYPPPVAGMVNVGILHTSLLRTDVRRYAPLDPVRLLGHGYHYWALGHVHERITRSSAKESLLHFPANTQALTSKDTGPRGVTIVESVAGEISSLRFYPTDIVRFDSLGEINAPTDTLMRSVLVTRLAELVARNGGLPVAIVPGRTQPEVLARTDVIEIVRRYSESLGVPLGFATSHVGAEIS